MADKGLNVFNECAAECVHLCPQEEECSSSSRGGSKMHLSGTIANSQRMPTDKNGAIAKVSILVEQVILKAFKDVYNIFYNEMPVFTAYLMLIIF